MLITGLDKYICTPRGVPFKDGQNDLLFGDALYVLAGTAYQGQSDEQKKQQGKIGRKLAIPCGEVELTTEEISALKETALRTGGPFYADAIACALEAGGIGDKVPCDNGTANNIVPIKPEAPAN